MTYFCRNTEVIGWYMVGIGGVMVGVWVVHEWSRWQMRKLKEFKDNELRIKEIMDRKARKMELIG